VGPRVALATYGGMPEHAPDDRLLAAALEQAGVRVEAAVWSNPAVDWLAFDAVVIRSCWDYHRRHAEFMAWLDSLDAAGRRVWNPTPMVRWNSNKRYLADLAGRGVATVPTRIIERGSSTSVADVAREAGWTRFVVKPAVSASAYETHALTLPLSAADEPAIERLVAQGDVLVQPFLHEVTTDGELSLLFFDGAFSHAAIKRTRPGDFRVQSEHGGTVAPIDLAPAIVAAASKSLDALDEVPLYARVDGVGDDQSFRVMELELIEPNVFLGAAEGSAERFARAIVRRLG
jgi:glutathione synthase/RimK-type ligase-like ATP-grasp enzyme